jgi:hypothetical protein
VNASLIVYSGLLPISRKTTPIAPSIMVRSPVWPWLSSWKEEWVVMVFT